MDDIALNGIIEDLYALYDGSESITVAVEAQRAAVMAHGWYTRVRRTGRALQALTTAGFEHEGAPLRRSIIEHALALHWLADANEDAVNALLSESQATWRRIAENLTEGWAVTSEDLNPILSIEIPKSSESTYLKFKQRCERYEVQDLYVAWLLETVHCHPSYASAFAYIAGDGNVVSTKLLSEPEGHPHSTAGVLATLLYIASVGFNKIRVGQPWGARLEDLHVRLNVAMNSGVPGRDDPGIDAVESPVRSNNDDDPPVNAVDVAAVRSGDLAFHGDHSGRNARQREPRTAGFDQGSNGGES